MLAAGAVRWWRALARLTIGTHMGTRAHCCWSAWCIVVGAPASWRKGLAPCRLHVLCVAGTTCRARQPGLSGPLHTMLMLCKTASDLRAHMQGASSNTQHASGTLLCVHDWGSKEPAMTLFGKGMMDAFELRVVRLWWRCCVLNRPGGGIVRQVPAD